MRFKVAKRDIEAALQVVDSSIVSSGSDMSAHYTFRRTGPDGDGKYGVEVLSYGGRIFSSCPLIVVVEDAGKKGALTIEGWRLKQWLQNIGDDTAPDFTLDEGEVIARVPRGKQTFQSLDPSSFPYWDKTLKDAKVTARIPANRLAAALAYSRLFASDKDKETKAPQLCVCEIQNGILYSTDKKAATLIKVEGMDASGLRVHVKDVGGFLTFLGTVGDGDVEVLEHERMALVRRCLDGAVFGEARFHFAYPPQKAGINDTDQWCWDIPKAEFQQAIGFLRSGAAKEDNRLNIAPGENAGEIILSMQSATGKPTNLTLAGIGMTSAANAPPIPDEGFVVDHIILAKAMAPWKETTVRFGLSTKGDRGLLRLVHEQFESKFLTVLPWMR